MQSIQEIKRTVAALGDPRTLDEKKAEKLI